MSVKRSSLVLLLIAVAAAAAAWYFSDRLYPIVNEHPSGTNIIALGDSLTAGAGAEKGEDYVSLLSRRFGIHILNKGVPGDTTEDALGRLDRDVLGLDPKIVIVFIGANDYLRQLPMDKAFANIETIITRTQRRGALVILVGMKGLLGGYDGRYKDLARKHGCPYVSDVLKGVFHNPQLMSPDGIHPNAGGYAVIADHIGAVLGRYL